jgi:hypothetical protein
MAAAAAKYQREVDHVEARSGLPGARSSTRVGLAAMVDCGTIGSS